MASTTLILSDGTITANLTDSTNYVVKRDTLKMTRETTHNENKRRWGVEVTGEEFDALRVEMQLGVLGATVDAMIANHRALASILRTAAMYSKRGWGRKVTLTIQYSGATNSMTYDVLAGTLPEPGAQWPHDSVLDTVPLTLICRAFGRSAESEVLAATTLTNHYDSGHSNLATMSYTCFEGDIPAEALLWFENNDSGTMPDSGAMTYDTLRIGCFTDTLLSGVTPVPVVEAESYESAGVGTISTFSDSACSGGNRVRIELGGDYALCCLGNVYASVADAAWQDLGTAFTLEFFLYMYAGTDNNPMAVVAKWNSSGNERSYAVLVEQKKLRFVVSVDGTNVGLDVRGVSTLTELEWNWVHVEFEKGDEVLSGWIYLNGALEASQSVDVATQTDTLDPNADGTDQDWYCNTSDYIALSDDLTSTYILGSVTAGSPGPKYDSVLFGTATARTYIKSVQIRYQAAETGGAQCWLCPYIHIGGTRYAGEWIIVPALGSPTWYSNTWIVNPATGAAWSQSDIDGLEAGITIQRIASGSDAIVRVYKMEAVVGSYIDADTKPHVGTAALKVGNCDGWSTSDSIDTVTASQNLEAAVDELRITNSRITSSRAIPVDHQTGGEALYYFSEGTGTAAADSSGNARDMTLNVSGWEYGAIQYPGSMSCRVTYAIPESLFEYYAGLYDVYVRVKVTADSVDDVTFRCAWDNGPWWTKSAQKVDLTGDWQVRWLGRVKIPWHAVQDAWITDDVFGNSAQRQFKVYTSHATITDILDLDYFLFIPVEPFSGIIKEIDIDPAEGLVISTLDNRPRVGRTGTTRTATLPPQSLDPQVIPPYFEPSANHYIVVSFDRDDGTNYIEDTIDLTARYMPRWLWMR